MVRSCPAPFVLTGILQSFDSLDELHYPFVVFLRLDTESDGIDNIAL